MALMWLGVGGEGGKERWGVGGEGEEEGRGRGRGEGEG